MSVERIAVVIPVYNRAKTVCEALDSVAAQTRLPQRLIVVDDGSSDNTPDAVRQWIARTAPACDPQILCPSHAGAAAARNYGAARVTDCGILAFLDSDDLWPEDFLERTVATLEEHPSAVAATCDRTIITIRTGESRLHSFSRLNGNVTTELFCRGTPSTSTTVLRTSAFRKAGGFDEALRLSQDYSLFLRVSLLGEWLHVPGKPVIYRDDKGGLHGEQAQISHSAARAIQGALQRVEMLDRFVHELGGAAAMPARAWRRRLGHEWYKAATRLLQAGEIDQARDCFGRAIATDALSVRARWQMWRLNNFRLIPRPSPEPK